MIHNPGNRSELLAANSVYMVAVLRGGQIVGVAPDPDPESCPDLAYIALGQASDRVRAVADFAIDAALLCANARERRRGSTLRETACDGRIGFAVVKGVVLDNAGLYLRVPTRVTTRDGASATLYRTDGGYDPAGFLEDTHYADGIDPIEELRQQVAAAVAVYDADGSR